ncbi:OsmC family protein [Glycomyces sp. NRRL B-16210]|uniref:OsmC family protein n=1 Tax=Glycomyces sp. NRRL B-16210 TaxID=1463821 RepID=UPI0004C15991|nr:OsmC family protein [Glycomyces sp. NRRL B-16210]
MTDTAPAVDNGVNVDALFGARSALSDSPEIAKFEWRSTVSWVKGTHSLSEVETFYGLGGEQAHTKKFTFDADHPPQFAAEDHGITPVEYVLVALGSCLTAGIASVAQVRQVKLNSVKATVAADFDLHGILGADPNVRNGFSNVTVNYEIDADASQEDIEAIVAQSQKRSAVYDALTNPTNVSVNVNASS